MRRRGVFRNPNVERAELRTLPGGTVVLYNPTHKASKRPSRLSEGPRAVRQPFDPAAFTFEAAPLSEYLCLLAADDEDSGGGSELLRAVWWGDDAAPGARAPPPPALPGLHALLINASPLWTGHGLFVPALSDGHLPQVLTEDSVLAALQLVATAGAPDFHAGFNSLGAWASVNHMHWHVGFMRTVLPPVGAFPCELAAREPVLVAASAATASSVRLSRTVGWPLPMLVFELPSAAPLQHLRTLARAVAGAAAFLQEANTAHNVLVGGGGRTVLLVPRLGLGQTRQPGFGLAVAMTCGLVAVTSEDAFAGMSAQRYNEALARLALEPAVFEAVVAAAAGAVVSAQA